MLIAVTPVRPSVPPRGPVQSQSANGDLTLNDTGAGYARGRTICRRG